MLVRTPKPADTESFLGYVLRVSEANGYDTPWHILRLAGISQDEMTRANFPVNKLAKILGVSADALDHIAYAYQGQLAEEYKLLGHPLGSSINQPILRLSSPALCPECVSADGHIDAFFDLKLAVACPVHKRTVISHCPICGEALRLFRPGQLTCRCGASLADAVPVPVTPAVIDLMNILKAKLHSTDLTPSSIKQHLPIKSLLAMPLRALITNLPNLLKLNRANTRENPLHAAELIAEALSDWPRGLHRFLDKAEEIDRNDPMSHLICFKRVSSSFFRKEIRENFAWLHQELTQHGLPVSGESSQSRQTLHKEAQRRYNLNKNLENADDSERTGFTPPSAIGQTLQRRDAAAYLGLPVSVLAQLQVTGHFVQQHCIESKSGYHLADLDAFFAKLLEASPRIYPSKVDLKATVSLSHALGKYRMHDSKQKAGLVVAYLSGGLNSIGRSGNSTDDIHFKLKDVSAFVASSRTLAAGGTLTQEQVAETLGCDPQAIPTLISRDYLTASPAREGTRITRPSFERFSQKYIPLAKIAKENDTTSLRLKRLCTQAGIPLLLVPRATGIEVPFIQRSHLERLLVTVTLHPSRKQIQKAKAQTEHPAVAALKSYLEGLNSRQEPLPIRAGKPNKKAIARACNFNRDVLYHNEEVVALLDSFTTQESMRCAPIALLQSYFDGLRQRRERLPRRAGQPNKKAIARACGFHRNVLYVDAEAISLLNTFSSQEPLL